MSYCQQFLRGGNTMKCVSVSFNAIYHYITSNCWNISRATKKLQIERKERFFLRFFHTMDFVCTVSCKHYQTLQELFCHFFPFLSIQMQFNCSNIESQNKIIYAHKKKLFFKNRISSFLQWHFIIINIFFYFIFNFRMILCFYMILTWLYRSYFLLFQIIPFWALIQSWSIEMVFAVW